MPSPSPSASGQTCVQPLAPFSSVRPLQSLSMPSPHVSVAGVAAVHASRPASVHLRTLAQVPELLVILQVVWAPSAIACGEQLHAEPVRTHCLPAPFSPCEFKHL